MAVQSWKELSPELAYADEIMTQMLYIIIGIIMMALIALLSTHFLTSSELANTFTLTKKHLDHHPRPP